MKNREPRTGGRSTGLLVLAVVVTGIVGSVASHFLAGVFPPGPVRDFFFKALAVGIPAFSVELGFATLTFGLALSVTTFAVILLVLAVYLWYKL